MKKIIVFFVIFFTSDFTSFAVNNDGISIQVPPLLQLFLGNGDDGNNAFANLTGKQIQEALQGLTEVGVEIGTNIEAAFKDNREELQRKKNQTEGNIAEIERAIRDGDESTYIFTVDGYSRRVNRKEFTRLLAEEKGRYGQYDSELKSVAEQEKYWGNYGRDIVSQGTGLIFGKIKSKLHEQEMLKKLVVKNAIIGDKRNEGILQSIRALTEAKTLTRVSAYTLALFAGSIFSYYGFKIGYNWLNAKIGKPALVRESTRHGWRQSLSDFWYYGILGYKEEQMSFDEVVLEPKMAAKLRLLADDTRNTMENGLPFRHVLFYGLPGTGKTMFAKRLAKYSEMDYAIMSGADFAQFNGGEGIVELHKLFDWAEQSSKGLLIFVDEADAFLRDRRVLNNQGKNLVNAFLSRTGTSAEKYMLVFATNYEDELDPAALSRIHKKVRFDLPEVDERMKIFKLYFDKYIVNDLRKVVRDGNEYEVALNVEAGIDQIFISSIVQKLDGFSGREIEQMVSELRISAYNVGGGILTKDIVNDVVDEKIKEHKHDMQCGKFQKKRYENELGQIQVSMNKA
jgi:ATPase family AAA domain-containing protein 3A/B